MPLQSTSGAASYDAYGASALAPTYVEDVFSTFLYTGNGSTQTITNGIDLLNRGGMVLFAQRSANSNRALYDTARGIYNSLRPNSGATAEIVDTSGLTAFNASGFDISSGSTVNSSSQTYVAWTFRKRAKFFDVVTYTGNATARTISHSLDSVPGCIIVRRTDVGANWAVYHRSLANDEYVVLNSTAGKVTASTVWNSTTPTSSVFSLGTDAVVNASGGTYVAYLFAHDAGGFGLSGTDSAISCGSFVSTGQLVNLGWEPQWLIAKNISFGATSDWLMFDNLRSRANARSWRNFSGSNDETAWLKTNTSGLESYDSNYGYPAETGFYEQNFGTGTWAYIAVRRGPMRKPVSGSSVYAPSARAGTGAVGVSTALGAPVDLVVSKQRNSTQNWVWVDRLRGATNELTSTGLPGTSEVAYFNDVTALDSMTGFSFGDGSSGQFNTASSDYSDHLLRRAPGFMDVVCYTGTGSNLTVNHNLGVAPELMIVKQRDFNRNWWVYDTATGNTKYQVLNDTATPVTSSTAWNNTTPTASAFTVGTGAEVNSSAGTYVAYLFATLPGVSKVFSYTGNGSSQTINCGFSAGARFVLIKRTDTAGDWYLWDSARGIVASNDPHLSVNATAAEVTTDDSLDPDNSGFVVNQVAATNINVSSATYIGLAIA